MLDEAEHYLKNNGWKMSMVVENNKPVGQRNSLNSKHNKD